MTRRTIIFGISGEVKLVTLSLVGRGIGGGVHENNTHCFLLRMAHLLIFIHNGGIWKGTIQPWLKKLMVLIFLVTKVFQKGYNVQIRQWMFNSQMRCYVTQWPVTSLVAWVCAATLSPKKFGSLVKIAFWPFLISKLLDIFPFSEALDVYSNRNFYASNHVP